MREVLYLRIDRLDTRIGEMLIVTDREDNLRAVDWTDCENRMHRLLRLHYGETALLRTSSQSECVDIRAGQVLCGRVTAPK